MRKRKQKMTTANAYLGKTRTRPKAGHVRRDGCAIIAFMLSYVAICKRFVRYAERLLVWKTGNQLRREGVLRGEYHRLFGLWHSPVCVSLRAYQSPQIKPYGGMPL